MEFRVRTGEPVAIPLSRSKVTWWPACLRTSHTAPVQSKFLTAEGGHELQGYLFSKPLPGGAFEEFLASCRIRPETIVCRTAQAVRS